MVRFSAVFFMVMLFYLQNLFFGENDFISLFLVAVVSILIAYALFELHHLQARFVLWNFKEDTFIYKFFAKKYSVTKVVVIGFSALVLSIILVVTIKGLVFNHGVIPFLFILAVICYFIFPVLNKSNTGKITKENLSEDVQEYADGVFGVFTVTLLINVALALALSARDVFAFFNAQVTLNNFLSEAANNSVPKNDSNDISRLLINLYITADYFRLAVANLVVDIFLSAKKADSGFYFFYLVTFVLNLFKLIGFSFSVVILQQSLTKFFEFSGNYLSWGLSGCWQRCVLAPCKVGGEKWRALGGTQYIFEQGRYYFMLAWGRWFGKRK